MSIANQIPPLNLNPIIILLQKIQYKFSRNRNIVLSQFDTELNEVDNQISRINQNISDVEGGQRLNPSTLIRVGADPSACSIADKNQRQEEIKQSLEERRIQLEIEKDDIQSERDDNERFYSNLLGTIGDILSGLIRLLVRLIDIIGTAITALEAGIASLAAIPLGAGLSGVAVLGFVTTLLQTKIFEPVSDTVEQQRKITPDDVPTIDELEEG